MINDFDLKTQSPFNLTLKSDMKYISPRTCIWITYYFEFVTPCSNSRNRLYCIKYQSFGTWNITVNSFKFVNTPVTIFMIRWKIVYSRILKFVVPLLWSFHIYWYMITNIRWIWFFISWFDTIHEIYQTWFTTNNYMFKITIIDDFQIKTGL